MNYEYGDDLLKIVVGNVNGEAQVGVRYEPADDFGNIGYTKTIPHEEAPALALAILEAAGIPDNIASESVEKRAVGYLRLWKQNHGTEETEARAFAAAIRAKACAPACRCKPLSDRDIYRAARQFFKEPR